MIKKIKELILKNRKQDGYYVYIIGKKSIVHLD